jgi:hypothetical protein
MLVAWISVGASDSSAFFLTLANAAILIAGQENTDFHENPEFLKYYTTALRSVNSRLLGPVEKISEGLIGAILGFVCHDVRLSVLL